MPGVPPPRQHPVSARAPASRPCQRLTPSRQLDCLCLIVAVGTTIADRPPHRSVQARLRSGKTMARTGLRMMPTFPLPPLKFRTAGFPRYGLKAGLSDEAFPAHGFAIVLRAVRPPSEFPCSVSGTMGLIQHLRASGIPLYPRGPRSGPGYTVPTHPRLTGPIRPTRRHIPTSPHCGLYEISSLCLPGAGLGDPRVVLSFHRCSFATCRPLRPRGTLWLLVPSTSPKILAFTSV